MHISHRRVNAKAEPRLQRRSQAVGEATSQAANFTATETPAFTHRPTR